jgi:hypothetical protein
MNNKIQNDFAKSNEIATMYSTAIKDKLSVLDSNIHNMKREIEQDNSSRQEMLTKQMVSL